MMKFSFRIIAAAIILLAAVICPALAFTAEEADVSVQADGSAVITADYSLSWTEYIAYSLAGNREAIAEKALSDIFGEGVTVDYMTADQTSVTIPSFATVSDGIYTTPKLPYDRAGAFIEDFSGKIPFIQYFTPSADSVVPEKTVITFPDGYTVTYEKPYPDGVVPSVTH